MNSSEKTATLLKLLGRAPYVHSVTELGEQISCSKSGTFKLLASLVKTGLAAQTPEHKYTLGPAVYVLGRTYEDKIGLSKMVKPYLVRLRDMTGENASLSMLINGNSDLPGRKSAACSCYGKCWTGTSLICRSNRQDSGRLSGRKCDSQTFDGRTDESVYRKYNLVPRGTFERIRENT